VVTYVQIRVTVICVAVSWVNTARKNKVGILPSWGARLELSYRRLLWMTSTLVVQEMLGHANIRQTMDTYSHVLPNMQQQAAERMDAMLG
jgi:integrase